MTKPTPDPKPESQPNRPPGSSRTFETQIQIHAPQEAVWEAIATDEGLCRWFAPKAKAESKVGGEIVWEWETHHQ